MTTNLKSILISFLVLLMTQSETKAQIKLLKDYQNTSSATIGTFMGVNFREGGFSGMFPIPNTNGTEYWVLSDRGVNVDCGNANLSGCRPTYDKMYAFPTFSPSIYRVRLNGSSVQILKKITIKRPDGSGATGLLNPTGFGSTASEVPSTDTVLDCSRFSLKTAAKDIWGTDPEGIAVDKQGNFWICEEGGPTIWKLNSNGVVINRFTPYAKQLGAQAEDIYIDSCFKYRKNNRGFEGICITPNGKVYAMIQSPILYPTQSVGEGTRIHRIIEIDPVTNATKMYAYLNDGIIGSSGSNQIRLRDWKIGDMSAINDSTFLVIEAALRGTGDRKNIHLININGATVVNSGLYGGKTLEALVDSAGLAAQGIKPVKKRLFMDLNAYGWDPNLDKPEGLAIINDSTIAVGIDNDFGQTCPLANGIPIATSNTSHIITYSLKGSNKIVGLKTYVPLLSQGITGPNSSQTPYLETTIPGGVHTALLTVGDSVGTYKLSGLGDGLGAFDNGNGTFTLLMNHEMGSTVGVVRDHGSKGAFVSKWVINKSDLSMVSGSDLIKKVKLWRSSTNSYFDSTTSFNRFCSADLPAVSAFYNATTGLGTQERLFMTGEEAGAEGRVFAAIATGANAGTAYELPYLGKFSWENAVSSPYASNKTIVVGLDDATPGQVYFYIGTKTNTGTEIEKAGLTGGKLFGLKVTGLAAEISASVPTPGTTFTLADLGQVQNTKGSALQTASDAAQVTQFLRPEDGVWDPKNPADFYFVTTNSFTAPSRMWRARFTDINNPELGGTITAVLDGTEGPKMMDNMTMDNFGHILIQEDPGNQSYLAKIWQYTVATDQVKLIATHDASRFVSGGANFLTQDEESSGIIDMQDILGAGNFIYVDQAHYAQPGALVEGGQLLSLFNPDTKNSFLGAGPFSSQTPYLLPSAAGVKTNALLTVGDSVGTYKLSGLGDGLGAYDNGNGTFTLLMNHEMGNSVGVVRDHGSKGAFISKWVINKSDLSMVSGSDLIKKVKLWRPSTNSYFDSTTSFNRFCAGDLPSLSAFYNPTTGLGTQERIFMNGEEAGAEGRAFANIATGANAGTTYELPYLGKFSWENAIASPFTSNKTIVAGTDDATPGQVYMYIGTKTNTGTEIEKAGLSGGKLYGVKVTGLATEVSASIPAAGTAFTMFDLGQVQNMKGSALQTASDAAAVTQFLRPEDGAWDPKNPSDFYFVTTNGFTAPSRLWRLRFSDINNPETGGTITAVLDGTEGPKMMDNMVIDNYGHIMIQEDPGNQAYLAKIWQYTIATDKVKEIATHDASSFVSGGANYLTQDEESSGIIDMQDILGAGNFIYVDQAHYAQPGALVEGGQLLSLFNPDTKNSLLGAAASSSQSPYLLPTVAGGKFTSILTAGDEVGGYKMAGIPDGLGAYDNNNGTFTVLMNHEIPATSGVVRAHGSTGAYVSKWIVNKSDLSVVSGSDLIKNVNIWNAGKFTTYNAANPSTSAAFGRFCSADLPPVSAFYNSVTGAGSQERIFLNGEEAGTEARAFAHIATGTNAGTSYELPGMGKFSWENAVASPTASDKTVVVGLDDATPGQVYVYIGTKTKTGTEVEKAGLVNGKLYGVAVAGLTSEVSASIPAANTGFSMVDLGDVKDSTGASLERRSTALGVTKFLRPEDGAWDPNNLRDFYFVTTNSFTAPSRMWRLRFNDAKQPELGGTITAVLDGTEGPKMMDNMGIDNYGHILLQEDVGNNVHLGKVWQYTIATDQVKLVATHDSSRFTTGAPNFLTLDEESSGVIDMQAILGAGMFLMTDQAHYSIPGEIYEGGQLLAFFNPDTKNSVSKIGVAGNNVTIAKGDASPSFTDNTDFGNVERGKTKVQTFEIKNAGPGELIVKGIRIVGSDAPDFSVLSPTSYPVKVGVGASQTFTIQFAPINLGGKVATVNILSNDFDRSNYDFVVQGIATVPADIAGSIIPNTSFALYPNPAGNSTNLVINLTNSNQLTFSMIDLQGKEVMTSFTESFSSGKSTISFNTSDLANGTYFVRIQSAAGLTTIRTVILH
jgi:secreted PhoX family phosphatase